MALLLHETDDETAVTEGYLTVSTTNSGTSTSTATGRITANIAGYYRFTWKIGGDNNSNLYTRPYLNGSEYSYILHQGGSSGWKDSTGSFIIWLDVGEYMNLNVYSNSTNSRSWWAGNNSVSGRTVQERSWIEMEYVGTDW